MLYMCKPVCCILLQTLSRKAASEQHSGLQRNVSSAFPAVRPTTQIKVSMVTAMFMFLDHMLAAPISPPQAKSCQFSLTDSHHKLEPFHKKKPSFCYIIWEVYNHKFYRNTLKKCYSVSIVKGSFTSKWRRDFGTRSSESLELLKNCYTSDKQKSRSREITWLLCKTSCSAGNQGQLCLNIHSIKAYLREQYTAPLLCSFAGIREL